tara:strand:+ start:401 stop:856 length:456 start_codon:yes stop_codon:yes gene_type:complete
MKLLQKIFFYILILLLGNCGYEPMYSKKEGFNIGIQSYQIEGNKKIDRAIVSSLNLKNQIKKTGYRLIIKSNKTLVAASKNSAGNISAYKTEVTVSVSLIDGNMVYKEKTFSSDFTYNNIKNKLDLSEYQKNIEENLINKIVEEIFIFLTL